MQSISTFLKPGGLLLVGDYVTSPNKTCFLIMQEDGNLVLYRGSGPNGKGAPIWASNTDIGRGDYFAQMQTDGNFCVYKGKNPDNKEGCKWASGTYGNRKTFLMVQDDLKIVIYKGNDPTNKKGFVWKPKTVPLNESELRDVANKYAPILRFHPREQYFPCSVEWFLKGSTLRGSDGTNISSPTVSQLPKSETDDGKYWLEMKDSVKPGDLSTAKAYVNVQWKQGQFYTDFEYWFFSGYNGPGTLNVSLLGNSNPISTAPAGEHWADWEMVMIRVDNASLKPLGVFLSQHGDGEFIVDLSRFQRQGDQFVVYPSLNGHANYPSTGDNPTDNGNIIDVVSWCLLNRTADNGQTFNSKDKIEVVAADYLKFPKPQWLSFPYRWGKGTQTNVSDVVNKLLGGFTDLPVFDELVDKIADLIKTRKLDDTNGPYGPQTQSYWTSSQIPAVTFDHGYTDINTSNPPAVLFVNGIWHCYYQREGHSDIMHAISNDGYRWEPKGSIENQTTSEGPFAGYFNNEINLFYRDGSGNRIYITSSKDGYNYNDIGQVDKTQIDGRPNVAVLNDIQCLVGVDAGGYGIMFAVREQSKLGEWTYKYTGHSTQNIAYYSTPPSIVAFNGLFHLYYRDGGSNSNTFGLVPNDGILHATSSDGVHWSEAEYIGYNTSSSPCAVVANGEVILFFRDPDFRKIPVVNVKMLGVTENGMMTCRSNDGKNFTDHQYTGLNIDNQPNATVVSDKRLTVLAKNAGGNGIMWLNWYSWK